MRMVIVMKENGTLINQESEYTDGTTVTRLKVRLYLMRDKVKEHINGKITKS